MKKLAKLLAKVAGFAVAIVISLKIFLRWPMFCVGTACIPISNVLQKWLKLTPVLSKLMSALIFGGLLWLSFHFGEVAVFLCAIALVQEVFLLIESLRNRFKRVPALC